ncbi:hypothetical protein B0H16DRAFT_1524726 [Mycena metata]|uniref:Uncharacterized protein n=1 Tax=Mycena metata TaxID=1033252 RepID=A0AAD7JJF5_9AGAR|nr:hypothetical protein B0H16DRAFT_1524726 [Mycena metata]
MHLPCSHRRANVHPRIRRLCPSPSPIPHEHPHLLPFDLQQRIRRASISYAPSQVPRPITAFKPIAALPRRHNKFMQYLLTAYIDRLRPCLPPHQAAPFALGTHTAAEQRLCAPSRSHRRANAHPYTVILRAASTTRARPQSSPPEARNQGSVSHPPRVNAPSRTYRAKPVACYQTKTSPNSHRPHLLPPSSSESDMMSTMSSLGPASDSSLTQTQFNPSQRSRVLLLSYP